MKHATPMLAMHNRRRLGDVLAYGVAAVYLVFALLPIYFVLTTAFKFPVDAFARPPHLIPQRLTLLNFHELFQTVPFLPMMGNSILITLATTIATLVIGFPAAYALTRFRFAGRQTLAFFILSMRMAPAIAIVLPVFLLYRQFGLINTYYGLVLIYTTFNLPFIIWLLRTFIAAIPVEIEESAQMDGCSRIGSFFYITIPLAAPGIAAAAVFAFMLAWNEFLFAFILSGRDTRTLPVAMSLFMSEEGVYWGQMSAASALVVGPILVFALLMQKYILAGLTLGATKS